MSGANPLISNGTCYSAAGKRMDQSFIPCGNDAVHHYACCAVGDLCLEGNACWHWGDGEDVTYLAGCSDASYADPNCPNKGAFKDQPWAGLVYCNGTSDEWIACAQRGSPSTITKGDPCWCPETSRTVAVTAEATLAYVASLPKSSGGSPSYQPGYTPTTESPTPPSPTSTEKTSSTSSSTSTSTSTTTSQIPKQTSSSSTSSTHSGTNTGLTDPTGGTRNGGGMTTETLTATVSITPTPHSGDVTGTTTTDAAASSTAAAASVGLTTGAKAGIGVGAGVGGIAVIALIAFFVMLLRQRQRGSSAAAEVESDIPPTKENSWNPHHSGFQYGPTPMGSVPPAQYGHAGVQHWNHEPPGMGAGQQQQYAAAHAVYAPVSTNSNSPDAQPNAHWSVPSHGTYSGDVMMTSGVNASELDATGPHRPAVYINEVEGSQQHYTNNSAERPQNPRHHQ